MLQESGECVQIALNASDLLFKCAGVIFKGLLGPVLMNKCETLVRREKGRSTIKVGQRGDLSGLLRRRKIERIAWPEEVCALKNRQKRSM